MSTNTHIALSEHSLQMSSCVKDGTHLAAAGDPAHERTGHLFSDPDQVRTSFLHLLDHADNARMPQPACLLAFGLKLCNDGSDVNGSAWIVQLPFIQQPNCNLLWRASCGRCMPSLLSSIVTSIGV